MGIVVKVLDLMQCRFVIFIAEWMLKMLKIAKNAVIFGVNISLLVHTDNRKKMR